MKDVYPGESRYILDPFYIAEGEVEFFDLGVQPIYRESFSFGKGKKEILHGFEIMDSCAECGTCKAVCPQQCIEEGSPYKINQAHCLHCGLCMQECPAGSIRKRDERK